MKTMPGIVRIAAGALLVLGFAAGARAEDCHQVVAGGHYECVGQGELTDCNIFGGFLPVPTVPSGSRSACVSARGAFDMVGNLEEWVADWVPQTTACGRWNDRTSPTGDTQCLAGAGTTSDPNALLRGGSWQLSPGRGPLAVRGQSPEDHSFRVGVRCAR